MDSSLFIVLVFFIYGSCIGSFLNVVIWRMPQGLSLTGRSHCPSCGKTLAAKYLFPIFSYVFLKGKCGYCKNSISPQYAIVEVMCGLLFAFFWYHLQPTDPVGWLLLLRILFIVSIAVAVFVIDLKYFLILDKIILPASLILLLINLATDGIRQQSLYFLVYGTFQKVNGLALVMLSLLFSWVWP
jgi:prepilin signal peptidase PulO-like enzyme (type II secretory pathway)